MSATEFIRLTYGSSTLVLAATTDIKGQVVTMEGSNITPVSVSNTSGYKIGINNLINEGDYNAKPKKIRVSV